MFEHLTRAPNGTARIVHVSAKRARELLKAHTVDVSRALDRLRGNAFAQLACDGGTIRWNPRK